MQTFHNSGLFSVNAPTPGCTPLNLSVNIGDIPPCIESVILAPEIPAPIPTLGQWGLIVLGLLIIVVGFARIRAMKLTI